MRQTCGHSCERGGKPDPKLLRFRHILKTSSDQHAGAERHGSGGGGGVGNRAAGKTGGDGQAAPG